MTGKRFVSLLLLLGVVIFTVQNHALVDVEFLLWSFTTNRAVLIFLTFCAGLVIGWLTASRGRRGTPPSPDVPGAGGT